jgi:hypothetical protein
MRGRLKMQTPKRPCLFVERNIALGYRFLKAASLKIAHAEAARKKASIVMKRLNLYNVKTGERRLYKFQSRTLT